MLKLFLFALILHTGFCLYPCKRNFILPKDIEHPSEIVGNWTYIYHWSNTENGAKLVEKDDGTKKHGACPYVVISLSTSKDADEVKNKCVSSNAVLPFKWEDAELKLAAPSVGIENAIVFGGQKKHWLLVACDQLLQVEIRKVEEDFILLSNPDIGLNTELLSRRPVHQDELECLLARVRVGDDLKGFSLCSQA